MRYKELIESKKWGDCFQVAGRNMLDSNIPELTLVHALVYGEGQLEGRRFPHAWNEVGDVVIDNSNGKNIVVRKELYYDRGKVKPNEPGAYVKFDKEQALINMVKYKHWGPWGLDESLEEAKGVNEMIDIPIGRKVRPGGPTAKIPSILYHSLRGRELGKGGEILGYPLSPKEKELEDLWVQPSHNGYVWLSLSPLDNTSVQIDARKLNPYDIRYTGQSEGYLLHKGPIPHSAIIRA